MINTTFIKIKKAASYNDGFTNQWEKTDYSALVRQLDGKTACRSRTSHHTLAYTLNGLKI